jgi:hypothetical protein
MKKLIAILALASYLLVTTGVVISYHYCMKRLQSTQVFGGKKSYCSKCGMHIKKSNKCCHDEEKLAKLSTDHNSFSAASLTIPALDAVILPVSDFIVTSPYNINERTHFLNHSPPLLSAQDIYLQINVLRI